MFFCEICKIFKYIFLQNTSEWLLLVLTCNFAKFSLSPIFLENLWETVYFMYKLQNFNHQIK